MWTFLIPVQRILVPLFLCLSAVLFRPASAAAVQQHGGAEGLVTHQIGHLLFIAGMGYLLVHVSKFRMRTPGWLEFRIFLWLLLFWNFLTFSGHWMDEIVDPGKFGRFGGAVSSFSVQNFFDFFFYLSRLDHLILVPSFLFLLLALKKWRREG